ncbi:Por secretion system C-terminal sorting domain-containing protein [Gracilimonas mengyeensis]|uniref:Por secretion system C-terminal sorting domain-containing protein n=2 Tax=Gracilimonas mengyeensis TaxID=1302730 RepID=A0A521C320_9BACT|nr:Por secretion system C-terminal sorting domain-containing protein [Gracilimonas mengyeensis]
MKLPALTTIIILATLSTAVFSQDQADFIQSETSGLVEIPAEQFSNNRPGSGTKAGDTFTQESAVVDYLDEGYMKANMADGDGSEENAENLNIKLSYNVDFIETGTHYVWARVYFQGGDSDSFFFGLNGNVNGQIAGSPHGQWRWERADSTLEIDSTGVHQIDFFGREPNSLLDHIVVTSDVSYDPSVAQEQNELTKIFVAPAGNDENDGSIETPLATMQKAQELATPGDTVYIRGGTYNVGEDQISEVVSNLFASVTFLDKSGTEGNRINYWAYPGETPVFDFSNVKPADRRVVGIFVRGDYIHLKGLELTGIQTTITEHTESYAIRSEGNHNIFENLSLHDNVGTGLRHFNGGHNLFLNIDAYRNWDNVSQNGIGDNNDGIGVHPNAEGVGNVIRGCRVWFNSDDGIDVIRADAAVEIDSSWAFYNGFDTNFNSLGDGTGFKLGGHAHDAEDRLPEVIPSHTITFSIAARNKANGFYANHHLAGNNWYNNSAFQNRVNFNMLNRPSREDNENIDTDGYDHVLINNLSHVKGFGFRHFAYIDTSQNTLETNSWELGGQLSDSDFESLDVDLLTSPRKEDGSLPDVDFMRPTEGSRAVNSGTDIGFEFNSSAPDLGAIETTYTTTVHNEKEGSIPDKSSLNQNYPNPFNPSTVISYQIPENSHVELKVFDMLGREISTLVNERKSVGAYEVNFEASELSSGMYIYTLKAGDFTQTKKMMLIK